ncbi:hypothetical protein Taro_049526 [Colocasia esculenta]|uniref:Transmembrane protein n=1 Tax=Colocasia esculenta TaxID=4460 RepID=A0A843XB47_COLES|nr:hypothetical protein [Colocasia esculenta]
MAKYSKTSAAFPLLFLMLYGLALILTSIVEARVLPQTNDESGKQVDVKPTAQRVPGRRVIRPPLNPTGCPRCTFPIPRPPLTGYPPGPPPPVMP